VSLAPQPSLALIDQDGSPLTLRNVQGGAFTSDGALLFLACDATDGAGNRKGFAVIDTATGKRIAHQRAFANPIMEGWEVEGIDAWDFRDPRDGKVNVLVGLLLLNNDWPSSDNITLRTFRVIVDEPAGPGQPTGCETLRQRYELLKADLAQTDDVNEAKLIRAAMDQIVRQMKQQGCANLP
jgi:hypothetical protein